MAKRKAAEAFSRSDDGERLSKPVQHQLSAFAAARARYLDIDHTEAQDELDDHNAATNGDIGRHDIALPERQARDFTLPKDNSSNAAAVYSSSSNTIRIEPFDKAGQTISLDQDAFVTILGEYELAVVSGVVSIYGASLHPRSAPQRVFAPSTHALPQIVARSGPASIRISAVTSSISTLERYSTHYKNVSVPEGSLASYLVLANGSSELALLDRTCSVLQSSKQDQRILTQLAMRSETSKGGICVACVGSKSVGKSSYARQVINKMISRHTSCYFLDLDPGQPEFGPSGQIYLIEVQAPLLGPQYTHFADEHSTSYRLIAAQTLAANSFKDNPQHYMDCVRSLFTNKALVEARRTKAPVVVNTCGWITDLGAKVLLDILQLGVTDAVMIDVGDTAFAHAVGQICQCVHRLPKPLSRPSPRSPAELRQMQMMAYFHSRPQSGTSASPSYGIVDSSISQWRPWIVNYGMNSPLRGIVSYGQDIDLEFVAEVLNGAIVAIVALGDVHELMDDAFKRTPEGLAHAHVPHGMMPEASKYICLALIRAIDTRTQTLQLVTPLARPRMAKALNQTLVLVRGAFDNPDWAYLEDVHSQPGTQFAADRPWVAQRERTGIEGAVWRLRHPPTAPRLQAI